MFCLFKLVREAGSAPAFNDSKSFFLLARRLSNEKVIRLLMDMPKYTKEELENAVKISYNNTEVLRNLGLRIAGGNANTLKKMDKKLGNRYKPFS